MDKLTRKKYIRLIYAKAFYYLGIFLVVSALISGIARSRLYFTFALCASSAVCLAWGWFTYLALKGQKLPGFGRLPEKKRTPFMYRKNKNEHKKPAFAMKSEDFDDDLNDEVSLSTDDFTAEQVRKAYMAARFAASAVLMILSFIIH